MAVIELIDEEKATELEQAGIDPEKMEYLKPDERIRILIRAGLDPEEYDF